MKPSRKPVVPRSPTRFPSDQVVERWDGRRLLAEGPEFEQFHFIGGDFGGADLSRLRFLDCRFERCNLAAVQLTQTALQNVAFDGCKLLGVPFGACRDLFFGVHFDHCQLRYATFGGRKMPATRFAHCTLDEADFTNADLTGALFANCSLAGTVFHDTQLAGADFRTATGLALDPEANGLAGARFALASLPGLLEKYGLVVE